MHLSLGRKVPGIVHDDPGLLLVRHFIRDVRGGKPQHGICRGIFRQVDEMLHDPLRQIRPAQRAGQSQHCHHLVDICAFQLLLPRDLLHLAGDFRRDRVQALPGLFMGGGIVRQPAQPDAQHVADCVQAHVQRNRLVEIFLTQRQELLLFS